MVVQNGRRNCMCFSVRLASRSGKRVARWNMQAPTARRASRAEHDATPARALLDRPRAFFNRVFTIPTSLT
ncbi:unnamed protein product [Colias eurytheme]|nr:unnamed protein product [Colias eurytheme]